jgi:hypothetical protein
VGKLLNLLPGSIGNPLIAAGRALLTISDTLGESAREMARARREILDLSFEEAMESVTEAARETAEALFNVPRAYRLLGQRRYEAQDPLRGALVPAPATASGGSVALTLNLPGGGGGGASSLVGDEVYRAVYPVLERHARATPSFWPVFITLPRPA